MSAIDSGSASFASRRFERGLRFVLRMYLPRTIGLHLGGLAVGVVLFTNGAHPLLWVALALNALVWPHAAYWLGKFSADPYRTELRSLMVDSALGGAWIALMKFNLLPSVLLAVMLSMDKLAVGGPKFLARCTAALVAGCVGAALAMGFQLRPSTTMFEIVGSLPLLVVYPLAVGMTTYNMARRMRYQSRQLEAMSRTDGLSQMLTRQSWERAVAEEFDFCRRTGRSGSLLMLDIDDVKSINDRHGFPAGDEVIRSVSAILRNSLREQDVPGRYGGEEFAVLLPGADATRAEAIAEHVRGRVEWAVLERSARVRGTVCVGFAEFRTQHRDYRDWISCADLALRAAKARGRNRVARFEPSGSQQKLA